MLALAPRSNKELSPPSGVAIVSQMTDLAHTPATSPSTSSSHQISFDLAQDGDDMGIDWDSILFSPSQASVNGTSPRSSLSLSSNGQPSEQAPLQASLPPSPSTPSPQYPPSVKLRPLRISCTSCGSPVVTPPLSPVALYCLEIHMRTRSQPPPPVAPQPPPKAPGRGRKRKLPVDQVPEDLPTAVATTSPALAPAPAPARTPAAAPAPASAPAPEPAPVPAPAKAKTKATTGSKAKGKATAATKTAAPDLDQGREAAIQPPVAALPASASGPLSSNQVMQDADDDLDLKTAEELRQELRKAKKFKAMWYKAQQDKNLIPAAGGESSSSSVAPEGSIARPPGERGKNGWNMQTMLRLEDDGDTYNAILGTTRNAVTASGLNWRLKFDEQDTGRLYACYGEMKRAHPHLKQFRNDWACRELVLGCLQNRRKSEHAKIKGLMTNKATDRQPSKRKGFKPRPRSKTTDPEPESGSDQNSENGEE